MLNRLLLGRRLPCSTFAFRALTKVEQRRIAMNTHQQQQQQQQYLRNPLETEDPEVFRLIEAEKYRQYASLELIASENFTSSAVMEANGSCLTNKYSEGLPGARYYGGNEIVDQIENLCIQRALELFRLSPEVWGVNVQSYSGSTANFSAFTALLKPHDRLMGLDLPSGGHLTHGYQTAKKKISSSAIYFESLSYSVDMKSGYIDYDKLEASAMAYRPKLIICGASAYCREWDYARLRKIADGVEAYLMADMAHISGLVAAQEAADPFQHCHVVTTTTHKTLRGPRSALIFFRKDKDDLEARVNFAVFPSCQGGPHDNTIAAMAVALKQANCPQFRSYAAQVRKNAVVLAEVLKAKGYTVVTDGTDNHIVLWDLRPQDLTGNKLEKVCELASITINKNAVPGDISALAPGGVRLGSAALTSRNFMEDDFRRVAEFLEQALQIALRIQSKSGKKIHDFQAALATDSDIPKLRAQVQSFAKSFFMPGFDPNQIRLDQNES